MSSILTVLPKYLRTSFSPARCIFSSINLKPAPSPGNESLLLDFSRQFYTQGKEVHVAVVHSAETDRESVKLAHCSLTELPAKLFALFKAFTFFGGFFFFGKFLCFEQVCLNIFLLLLFCVIKKTFSAPQKMCIGDESLQLHISVFGFGCI